MKPTDLRKAFRRIFVVLTCALITGCASTPEQRQADQQKRAAEEQHKIGEEQSRWQRTLAPYTDEQLRFKLEGLEQAIARGKDGTEILLRQGNGIGVLIAQGQVEAKVRERDAVGLELIRRGGAPAASPPLKPEPNDSAPLKGSGSGFFITEEGYFVTCQHVVKNASKILVQTTKGGRLPAALVREDQGNDLAVLKVEGTFSALRVISSRAVKRGDSVLTIGFPNPSSQGVEPKFTRGEVSSLTGIHDDPRCFQISVAIQGGNSGGPLVNQSGDVVGIVSAKLGDLYTLKQTGALPQNVNYAVKSSSLNTLLESLPDVAARLKDPRREGQPKFDEVVKETEAAVAIVWTY